MLTPKSGTVSQFDPFSVFSFMSFPPLQVLIFREVRVRARHWKPPGRGMMTGERRPPTLTLGTPLDYRPSITQQQITTRTSCRPHTARMGRLRIRESSTIRTSAWFNPG